MFRLCLFFLLCFFIPSSAENTAVATNKPDGSVTSPLAMEKVFKDYDGVFKRLENSHSTLLQMRVNPLGKTHFCLPISFLYCVGILFFIGVLAAQKTQPILQGCVWAFIGTGFLLHGYALVFKRLSLGPFPIATFFDALLFVAWVAVLLGFFILVIFRSKRLFFGALLCSALLTMLLSIGAQGEIF